MPALIGVVIGALATFIATAASERARWRREQSVRWDERRLAAYTEYAHAVKRVASIAVRLATHHGTHGPDVDALSPDEALPALAAAGEERTIKWEAILLLGTGRTIAAARRWHEAVSAARRGYYLATKSELGIDADTSGEEYEWQLARIVRSRRTPDGVAPTA